MEVKLEYYDKFEYRGESFRSLKTKELINEMNRLGNEGWELIQIVQNEIGSKIYLFKRKLVTV